ncbi:hypothetical protein INR76_00250 [Marixanthomonas sp. SCSIO 43207]|uniref:hypothetical protein n=1 Tax=Marixanthomonas sp. SCSIO 43207 TaxID=2779360 RepID=UPI001CA7C93D|nr:hypothetical protein [Marixanthomonas sp. SCSIO 43207]UAB81222.1 hypothetical protein INR76_00250 [Marixanthomonas sp. SCSIO 43207]
MRLFIPLRCVQNNKPLSFRRRYDRGIYFTSPERFFIPLHCIENDTGTPLHCIQNDTGPSLHCIQNDKTTVIPKKGPYVIPKEVRRGIYFTSPERFFIPLRCIENDTGTPLHCIQNDKPLSFRRKNPMSFRRRYD